MSQRAGGMALDAGAPLAREASPRLSIWAKVWPLLAPQRGVYLFLVCTGIVSGFTESAILAVLAETAATIATGARRAHVHIGPLHAHPAVDTLFAVALGLVVLRLLLQVPISILPPRIISRIQAEMRTTLFGSFTRASWEVQARDREGQLQETMTGQVGQATSAVQSAMGLLSSSILLVVLLVSAFALNAIAASFVLVLTALLMGLLRPLRKAGVKRARSLSRAQVDYARGIAESIRVAEETQVFGAGAAQRRRIGRLIATIRRHTFAVQMLLKFAANLYGTIVSLLFVSTLFLLYEIGRSHAAALAAVVLILVRASTSGQNIQMAYQGTIQSMPFLERTQEAERRYRESVPVEGTVALGRVATLAFEGVGYSYRAGVPVLSDVSFEVDGGEVIGVIGPSGAGKSTLVQLLLRLRAPGEGRYLVNGVPAREILQDDWHRRVAYVPQEPRLLHATVAENIRFFRDIDDQAVEHAGRLARIHEDVMGWRDGYETVVGPRADAVSGGQQQRICLARALVARPELLVLDEPTSALDPTSEALIQESLTGLKAHELTLFIVAHRMSTLNICDRVMIVIDGRMAGFDTIEQLRQHNAYYRSASQLATGAPAGGLP
jgi:ATP-binding cassette subfamily B protein